MKEKGKKKKEDKESGGYIRGRTNLQYAETEQQQKLDDSFNRELIAARNYS